MQPLTSALVFPENLRETNRSFTAFGVLIVLLVLFRVEFYSKLEPLVQRSSDQLNYRKVF